MYDYWEDGENEKCEYMCGEIECLRKELNSDISKWEEKRYFSKTETLISNNIKILFKDI